MLPDKVAATSPEPKLSQLPSANTTGQDSGNYTMREDERRGHFHHRQGQSHLIISSVARRVRVASGVRGELMMRLVIVYCGSQPGVRNQFPEVVR